MRRLFLLAGLAPALFATPAPAQIAPTAWNGQWNGAYNCGDGVIQLALTIESSPDGQATALYEFSAPDPRGTATGRWVPLGSFSMSGRIEPNGRFLLKAGSWIKPAYRFDTVDLSGTMNAAGEMQASILRASCSSVRLRR